MKPEIVSYDFGRHNEMLAWSTKRMQDSAQWKRQRVVVVLPASDNISTKVALSHWNLIFPPNNAVHRIIALGQEVGEAYSNVIAQEILPNPELSQWEYILTIEHDNVPPPDGLVKLIESMDKHPEYACIGGLYWTKGEGGVPQIWGDPTDPILNFRPQPPKIGEVVECCGTGMGFNLWRMSMFKDERLRKPWFKTLNGSEGQGVGTQDLHFWSDARKNGYRCAVDCRVLVGHYDAATGMNW
jgi:hypothetical protein